MICLFSVVVWLFVLASTNAQEWRSTLYPENWTPGNSTGKFLHDFSYAGYHRGEVPIPSPSLRIFDVSQAPYLADLSGNQSASEAIQAAIGDAEKAGGGIVFLPAGSYRLSLLKEGSSCLRIQSNNIILRGAGADKTFLFCDNYQMRAKSVILVKPADASSWYVTGNNNDSSPASVDIAGESLEIPVESPEKFNVGDTVIVRSDLTDRFIQELGMTGKWTIENMKGRSLVFYRKILEVNPSNKTLKIDAPTRYPLLKIDHARVIKIPDKLIKESGLEDFSIGMNQHPGAGFGDSDDTKPGTGGYEVHQSFGIFIDATENCWVQRINSYAPAGNRPEVHFLSNGLKFTRSRFITIKDCNLKFTQFKGGGGNGYLYTLQGQEGLIHKCTAEGGRHNYDFGNMTSSGNAIVDCLTKNGRLPSDFHMFFSVSNLIDNMTCDGDFLEAKYRPFGGTPEHGITTSQSVFWNTHGLKYVPSPFEYAGKMHNRPQILVESKQFGDGYVIGTRGPANAVDSKNFVEGVGKGETLVPRSLYFDQLERRLKK